MLKALFLAIFSAAALLSAAPAAQSASLRFSGTTPSLTFDPHATNDFVTTGIFRQVYDSLVNISIDMELSPGLATSWEYAGNATWRFKIREGVKFHDGRPLVAEDVAFSIHRQKDSRFYTALFGDIREAKVIDANTVDVVSNNPDPILPRKMSRMFIMSKSWTAEKKAEAIPDLGAKDAEAFTVRNANGTGPMKLKSEEPGIRTVFERNREYWGAFPGNLDEAIYQPIGSAPTRVAALLSGQVDLVVDLPLQDVDRVKATPGFKFEQKPQLLWMELELDGSRDVALNVWDKQGQPLKANPLKDARVRQAFAHAIDAQLIVDRVMRGQARVVGIASVPGLGGYQAEADKRWPTDLAKAKALLTAAGYPDGFAVQLNCPLERYVNTEEICRAVASMLARIGVEVRVNGIVWPEFARMLVNGPTSSFHLIGVGPNSWDTQDAFTSIMMTRDTAAKQGFFNWALWSNAELDNVAKEIVVTFDEARRRELYRKGLELGRDHVHAIYLHQPTITWGMKTGVTAPIRPDATLTLQNVVVK